MSKAITLHDVGHKALEFSNEVFKSGLKGFATATLIGPTFGLSIQAATVCPSVFTAAVPAARALLNSANTGLMKAQEKMGYKHLFVIPKEVIEVSAYALGVITTGYFWHNLVDYSKQYRSDDVWYDKILNNTVRLNKLEEVNNIPLYCFLPKITDFFISSILEPGKLTNPVFSLNITQVNALGSGQTKKLSTLFDIRGRATV